VFLIPSEREIDRMRKITEVSVPRPFDGGEGKKGRGGITIRVLLEKKGRWKNH